MTLGISADRSIGPNGAQKSANDPSPDGSIECSVRWPGCGG